MQAVRRYSALGQIQTRVLPVGSRSFTASYGYAAGSSRSPPQSPRGPRRRRLLDGVPARTRNAPPHRAARRTGCKTAPRPRPGRRNLNRCAIDLPDVWHAAANGTHEVRFVRGHLKIHGTRNYVAHFSIHLRLHHWPSTTAHTRTASATPFSACSPRSSNRTPADVRASERTVSDTSTSPGAESPLMREAILTAPPYTLLSSRMTSPAWRPRWMGRAASSPARPQARAASIACRAEVKTARTPSPSSLPSIAVPACS